MSNPSTLVNYQDAATRIKEMLPLSQLVRETGVKLKLSGKEQTGLCPFHEESTPSFSVNDDKGLYFCRGGCGARGDVISYFAQYHGVEPGEAIVLLSRRLSIPLNEKRGEPDNSRISQTHREALQTFHDAIADAAFNALMLCLSDADHPVARYLSERGITASDCTRYRLGFIDAETPFEQWMESLDLPSVLPGDRSRLAQLSGFLYHRQTVSAFQGRLLFPISGRGGRVCAFSGRIIPGLTPNVDPHRPGDKYRNSPDTPLFDKSQTLYGLTPYRGAMQTPETASQWRLCLNQSVCYLVEGYTDVIALGSAGVMAIAAMGTAVSDAQLRQIFSRFDKLVILMDGDSAGQEAMTRIMLRAMPLLSAGKRLSGVMLDHNDDPDALIQRFDRNRGLLKQHLQQCRRVTPESVWFEVNVGETESPVSIGDQAHIEYALAQESAPQDPIWRLALGRYITSRCGYVAGSLHDGRSAISIDDHQMNLGDDDAARYWLIRFARAPHLIVAFCHPYHRRWWVRDALRGLHRGQGEVPQSLRLILRAAYTLSKLEEETLATWPDLVRCLADNGFPSLWLQQWACALTLKNKTGDAAYHREIIDAQLWRHEWTDALDSMDARINDALVQAVIAISVNAD